MSKISLGIFIFVFIVSCVSKKPVTSQSTPAPQVKIEEKISVAEIADAQAVYTEKCSMCHKPYSPGDYNESDWKIIVPDMVNKANRKEVTIGPGQQELILQYLLANAKK